MTFNTLWSFHNMLSIFSKYPNRHNIGCFWEQCKINGNKKCIFLVLTPAYSGRFTESMAHYIARTAGYWLCEIFWTLSSVRNDCRVWWMSCISTWVMIAVTQDIWLWGLLMSAVTTIKHYFNLRERLLQYNVCNSEKKTILWCSDVII